LNSEEMKQDEIAIALEDGELRNSWTQAIINWNCIASFLRFERMRSVETDKNKLRETSQVFSFITKEKLARADKITLNKVIEMEAFKTLIESQSKICQSEVEELDRAIEENDAKETVDGFVDVIFTTYYDTYLNFLTKYAMENPNKTIREWCEEAVNLGELFDLNFTFYDFLYNKVGEEKFKQILGIPNSRHIRELLISSMEECISNNYTKFVDQEDVDEFVDCEDFFVVDFGESGKIGAIVDDVYKIRKHSKFEEPDFQGIIDAYMEEV